MLPSFGGRKSITVLVAEPQSGAAKFMNEMPIPVYGVVHAVNYKRITSPPGRNIHLAASIWITVLLFVSLVM